ncbi:MAG: tetratricopeptide repeat protein, partial [Pseudonocardiaceae bacterium]
MTPTPAIPTPAAPATLETPAKVLEYDPTYISGTKQKPRRSRWMVKSGLVLVVLAIAGSVGAVRNHAAVVEANRQEASATRLRERLGPQTDKLGALQDRVRTRPNDWEGWAALGASYVERGRVTGDSAWYPKAQGSYQRALDLGPGNNAKAEAGMATLASARHDFGGALVWADQAIQSAPEDPVVLAAWGDALLELGRYDEAFDAYQKLVNLRPDVASYARVSYARELQGDFDGAIAAMEAVGDAAGNRSDEAFAEHYLGELNCGQGRIEEAERHYRRAIVVDPQYVPPQAGQAKLLWAQGQTDKAVDAYRQVLNRLPAPQYVGELADLFTRLGRTDEAQEQFELLDAQR